jgi:hypothetical protein
LDAKLVDRCSAAVAGGSFVTEGAKDFGNPCRTSCKCSKNVSAENVTIRLPLLLLEEEKKLRATVLQLQDVGMPIIAKEVRSTVRCNCEMSSIRSSSNVNLKRAGQKGLKFLLKNAPRKQMEAP